MTSPGLAARIAADLYFSEARSAHCRCRSDQDVMADDGTPPATVAATSAGHSSPPACRLPGCARRSPGRGWLRLRRSTPSVGRVPRDASQTPAASAIRREAALPLTILGTALARRTQREGQDQYHLTERAVVRPPGIRSPPAAASPAGPGASASCALSTSLRIFPVAVRGNVLVNAQRAGTLQAANARRWLAVRNKVLPRAAIWPWCGHRGLSSLRLWSDRHHGGSISVDAWRVSAPGGGSSAPSARSGEEEGTAPVSSNGIPDLRC